MSTDGEGRLPAEIEDVIRRVLEEAGLGLLDGRDDVERELRDHFEDGLAAGSSVRRLVEDFGDPVAAGRRIGGTRPRAAERVRGGRRAWWRTASAWLEEGRHALLRLTRARGFAFVVVLTLALGVGANTAVFTVLDSVVLRDLPYEQPDRLVRVYESRVDEPDRLEFMRAPLVAEFSTWDEVFDGFGALYTYREVGADLTDGDRPERVNVLRVSAGYFETLGVLPARGRPFLHEESLGQGESTSSSSPAVRVAVISHRLWATNFAADPDVLGRTLALDGYGFEVVGVMPDGFRDPIGPGADVWIPQDLRPGGSNSFGNYYLSGVARLREGLTLAAAQDRAEQLAARFAEAQPDAEGAFPRLVPLKDDVVGDTRRSMLGVLAAAAGLVLLTACVNVANLLMARGLDRDRELALRAALGSGRARLAAGILVEHGVLAFAGGVAGLAVAWLGVRGLMAIAPDALPDVVSLGMGWTVFAFTLGLSVLALALFGLAPALRLARAEPAEVLRSGDRSSTAGRAAKRLKDAMVVAQVAAALVLVAGSLLLSRSFATLLDVPLGLDATGVLTYEVHLPSTRYPTGEDRHRFHQELHDRVASLPEVVRVGAISWLPVNGRFHTWGYYREGEDPGSADFGGWISTDVRVFEGDPFAALGVDVVEGARPGDVDLAGEPVVWINQVIADRSFQDTDPVGQRIRVADAQRRVVGVVANAAHEPRGSVSPKAYIPHAQYADDRNWALTQTVRARGDLGPLLEQVRGQLAELDPQLVLYRPQAFSRVLERARAQDRFATALMTSFAGLALVLSVVGLYGVLAGAVAGRTREIGIRMALGADSGRVRRMVVRYAAALTLPGVLLGIAIAWLVSGFLRSLLFGVEPGDPAAYGASVLIFLGVGLLSAWLPARRATRVDAMRALTAE